MNIDCSKCKDKCDEFDMCKEKKIDKLEYNELFGYFAEPPSRIDLMNKINEIIDYINRED